MTRSYKPANQVSKKIKAFVDKLGKQQQAQPVAKPLTQPRTSVAQKPKPPAQALKSKVAVPASASPVNPTQPANPVNHSTSLVTVGTGIVAISGVFALLIFLSQSKINANEIALTTVGVLLSLGLVAIGFLWLKVMDRYNL
jgi:hypothetical protein